MASMILRRAALLVILVVSGNCAMAQNYKLHPLFIYSFTRYVQWPDDSNTGDFEIMVLGESPIVEELKSMAQTKKVGERVIKVININTVAEIKKCHMLFVTVGKSDKHIEVLQKTSGQPILVISEQAGLGALGSCINFIAKDGKLAFELNQAAFTKQNLKASTELTRLAIMI
jgi:hypothetical protein